MARVRSSIKISGKVGDEVHVRSKQGQIIRKAPKKGAKKDESPLKQQNKRTGFLNKLAGDLNKIIGPYSGTLKPTSFYTAVLKRFRKEPLNNRFLLLRSLEGMDVHPRHLFSKLGDAKVTVEPFGKKINVGLRVVLRPPGRIGRDTVNCYTYEVCLLCWEKGDGPIAHERQFSEWIYLTDGLPEFEFSFARRADTEHWLVCVKQQAGRDEQPLSGMHAEGMQIIQAGTFDKEDMALLAKRKEEEKVRAAKGSAKNGKEQIIRVKAKRLEKGE